MCVCVVFVCVLSDDGVVSDVVGVVVVDYGLCCVVLNE